jgi:hypothetical protein
MKLFIIALLLISSTFASSHAFSLFSSSNAYTENSNRVIKNHAKLMQKQYGLNLGGTGGSGPADIVTLYLYYELNQTSDVAHARKLYVSIIESLIKMVNEDKGIRPYLRDFPFTYQNCDITLSFYKKDKSEFANGTLSMVALCGKDILYYTLANGRNEVVHEEPYEEALKILQSNNPL